MSGRDPVSDAFYAIVGPFIIASLIVGGTVVAVIGGVCWGIYQLVS